MAETEQFKAHIQAIALLNVEIEGIWLDKWEEMMKRFMTLPKTDQMKQLDQSKKMCICADCPSHMGTGESEVLFCGVGKSSAVTKEKGCSCGLCLVVAHMGLTRLYYCTRGNEREQRNV